MKLSDAIRLAGGPKPDVYLDRILVTRMREDSSFIQLRVRLRRLDRARCSDDLRAGGPGRGPDLLPHHLPARAIRRDRRRGAPPGPGALPRGHDGARRHPPGRRPDPGRPARGRDRAPARRTGPPARWPRPCGCRSTRAICSARPGDRTPGRPAAGVARAPMHRSSHTTTCSCSARASGRSSARVVMSGQVKSPGRYSLRSKTERLADLIERAGGLTAEAYPGGIQFYRSYTAAPRPPEPTGCRLLAPSRRAPARGHDPPRAARAGRDRPAARAQGSQDSATTSSWRAATRSTSRSSTRS